MLQRKNLVAVLAATTCLATGAAWAADHATQPPQTQAVVTKDAGKLSADGSKAYLDVALTRLAIFDGRINDAKKFVSEADSEFDKAKADDSVFLKAEADLKSPDNAKGASETASTDRTAGSEAKTTPHSTETQQGEMAAHEAATTPKRWLPVDAEMSLDEDFTANPQKAAAVAEANKSLAKGDKQDAMQKLKLADVDVDVDYVMAVVPLDQTLTDVQQAKQLVNGGKYYEASQVLRRVEGSTRYDLLDVNAIPNGRAKAAAATH